jgi:hypothetical protein
LAGRVVREPFQDVIEISFCLSVMVTPFFSTVAMPYPQSAANMRDSRWVIFSLRDVHKFLPELHRAWVWAGDRVCDAPLCSRVSRERAFSRHAN